MEIEDNYRNDWKHKLYRNKVKGERVKGVSFKKVPVPSPAG